MARLHGRGSNDSRKRIQTHKSRVENVKSQRLLVMLACEGEKTERFYFEEFFNQLKTSQTISKTSCVIASHHHTNPSGVLDDLLSYKTRTGNTWEDYEEKWIVFDRDEERVGGGGHTLQDYMKAITKASDIGVNVAWSNPSFEIWYLLHFQFRNTGIHRNDVIEKLSECLERDYIKSDKSLFSILLPKMNEAIRNANRLLRIAEEEKIPAQVNPATAVVVLIEKLLHYMQVEEITDPLF